MSHSGTYIENTMFDADYLGNKGYYWGEIPQDEARSFIKIAKSKEFQAAVTHLEISHPGMGEYITSHSRSDWVYSCRDFSPGQKCLDIGSGWGAITFSLAEHFEEVWSMEAVRERLEFQQIRARQEKRKNIHFVRSDWLKLPFPDNSFDLVVVNGVLEWIGLSDISKSPHKLQQQFLSEVLRVLKPGGCVYIGVENRLAFYYFFGGLDHSGLPFTSLIPRFLADWAVRRFRKSTGYFKIGINWPNYRTYTYTKWGYQSLLVKSGFNKINFNWALAYNSPTETGRFDGESFKYLLALFRQHNFSVTISSKLATFFSPFIPKFVFNLFFPIFCPSFLIFAYKGAAKETFEEKLLRKVGQGATSFIKRSGTHGITSKINYIFTKNGQPTHIVKFSRFIRFQNQVAQEEKLLARMNNLSIKELEIDSRKIFIEPFIKGKICRTFDPDDNTKVIKWLVNFKKNHKEKIIDKKEIFKHINETSDFLGSTSDLPKWIVKVAQTKIHKFADELIKQKAHWTAEHGDFVKTNIIIGENEQVYVLDWEFYEPKGVPMWDLLMYVINNARVGSMPGCFIDNFTGRGPYSPILKNILFYYSREMNLPAHTIILGVWYVLTRAFYKRFNDPLGRHLDTRPFIELITTWYKIEKQVNLWINSQ